MITVQASGKGPRLNAHTSYTCAPEHHPLTSTTQWHPAAATALRTSQECPTVCRVSVSISQRRYVLQSCSANYIVAAVLSGSVCKFLTGRNPTLWVIWNRKPKVREAKPHCSAIVPGFTPRCSSDSRADSRSCARPWLSCSERSIGDRHHKRSHDLAMSSSLSHARAEKRYVPCNAR